MDPRNRATPAVLEYELRAEVDGLDVGRLFHEIAVTMAIAVSAVVSLTLTPMMCSRFLKDQRHVRHGRPYMLAERFFDGRASAGCCATSA